MTGRNGFIAGLLFLAAGALSAGPMVLLGGSAAYASQDTEANQPWDAEAVGLAAQSYIDIGPNLGAYTAATIGFVVASHAAGVGLDIGQYQTFSINVLLGIGTEVGFDPLGLVAGAGLYFGANSLNSNNGTLSSYAAGGIGGGIGLSFLYSFSYDWGIGVNVNAAYYFAIPGSSTPTMAASGFSVFGGLGLTYFFHPSTDIGPGISRY